MSTLLSTFIKLVNLRYKLYKYVLQIRAKPEAGSLASKEGGTPGAARPPASARNREEDLSGSSESRPVALGIFQASPTAEHLRQIDCVFRWRVTCPKE